MGPSGSGCYRRQAPTPRSPAPRRPFTSASRSKRRLTPNRLAVIGASESLTYAELDAASNRLANHLEQLGGVRGQRVGLCMERTPSMIVALLAIMKAGGAYVPLNYEHPEARISHQLLDAGARVLVTEQHLLGSLPALDGTVVCVDRDAEAIASLSPESLGELAVPEDLAYVMYTSGSTGTPKGVAVTHGNLSNYGASIAARLSVGDDPRGSCSASCPRSAPTLETRRSSPPLVSGGSIRLIGAEAAMDGGLLAEELGGDQLDVLKIAPSHLQALLASRADGVLPRRWLVVGGEALSWELVEQIRSQSPTCEILNHYGPTETTVGCTTYLVDDRRRPGTLTVPIGYPLAGTRAYVLDRRLEPVPAGVPGELCIAGAGVAAGYLGAAEESGDRFVADRFAPDSGAGRMYRTGDRVRRLRDDAIEFLGRLDDQVKIRGFRIEPGEIEATLLAHSAIRQVAVCAEDDQRGGLRLVAYIVSPEAPARRGAADFPRRVPAGPHDPFGVQDRGGASADRQREGRPPRPGRHCRGAGQARGRVRSAAGRGGAADRRDLGRALGGRAGGALDDFFALGGHSLLAAQATMRIRRRLRGHPAACAPCGPDRRRAGRRDSVDRRRRCRRRRRSVTDGEPLSPAKRALLERALLRRRESVGSEVAIPRRPGSGPAPLSFAQQRMWFLDQWEPGAPTFNGARALRLRGPLDRDALERSLRTVIERHESLRTVIVPGAEPLQRARGHVVLRALGPAQAEPAPREASSTICCATSHASRSTSPPI